LGRFDYAETSYQTCDSNKLLPDFNPKNRPEKLSKKSYYRQLGFI